MPKQHNALYGDDLHNPKGMTVDSHASSSKFVISASNMTITASGFTVKATAFQGDGSGLTGVPANDWDGSHTGNGIITGNLEVQGNSSGSFGSTGSWGKVVASKFYGNGANIVGVTAEWDGTHTGTAAFTGNVTSSGNISASLASTGSFGRVQATTFVGDGTGITNITGEWDGSHTGTATFTGNVTASGVVSASGGFVGDGSNLTGVGGGGGLTHDFYASSSLVAGDGVIINSDGSVKKIESETVARKIPMKDYGGNDGGGLWYNGAGWQFDGDRSNAQKKISYDPNAADRFVFAYADYGNSNTGKAMVGTISIDTSTSDNNKSKIEYGGASTFKTNMGDYLYLCEFIPGSSSKFVVMYLSSTTGKICVRVGTISGTAPNETIAFGTESVMTDANAFDHAYNVAGIMDPSDTTNGTMIAIGGTSVNSGSAWIGTVSGTSFSWGREYTMTAADLRNPEIAADPNNSGKFCAIYDDQTVNVSLSSNIITRSGAALSFGSVQRVINAVGHSPSSIAYDPNTANSIAICLGSSSNLVAGVQSGTSVSWGSPSSAAAIVGGRIRFNPHIAGVWGIFHQYGSGESATGKFTHGTLSGTNFTTANSDTYQQTVVYATPTGLDFDFDKVTVSKFSAIFGGTGGYEETSGRVSVGQLAGIPGTNLTTSNWAGMATGTTSASLQASITTRGGVASDITGSGLIPGTVYYLQGDGSLATTADTVSVKAGKALSATSIILTAAPLDGAATSAQGTTADAALPKAGGAMTGAITTNSTFDGVDIATRDAILTSTTTTAGAALPKAGGTMTGGLVGTTATFTGNISSSLTSTGSFGKVLGDGSALTGLSSFAGADGSAALFSGSAASTASFGSGGVFIDDGDLNTQVVARKWDISTMTLDKYMQDGSPEWDNGWDIKASSDGKNVYVVELSTNSYIYQYKLSGSWDIGSVSSVSSASFSSQGQQHRGVTFSPDGTKLITAEDSNDLFCEYTLSTPWDITTRTFIQSKSGLLNNISSNQGLGSKPDGKEFYVTREDDYVSQYTCAIPWDVSTMTLVGHTNVAGQGVGDAMDVFFRGDGRYAYIFDKTADDFNEWKLSTPWLFSTATYTGEAHAPGVALLKAWGNPEGTRIFGLDYGTERIYQYSWNGGITGSATAIDVVGKTGIHGDVTVSQNLNVYGTITGDGSGITGLTTADGFDYSAGSDPVVSTNPSVVGATWINTSSGEIFVATTVTAGSNVWKGTAGTTVEPAAGFFGDRGMFAGGDGGNGGIYDARIDYIDITTAADAADFGDLTAGTYGAGGASNSVRGVIGGGHRGGAASVNIDYITIASLGDGTDFGDLQTAKRYFAACGDGTKGIWGGGSNYPTAYNHLEYVTIATTGNVTDYGDLSATLKTHAACGDGTKAIFGGGSGASWSYNNTIEYIVAATGGSATDFGDLSVARRWLSATSNATRGLFCGGYTGAQSNVIDYITMATPGNATDFGDLSAVRESSAACANATRAVIGSGEPGSIGDTMEHVTIASTSNSFSFGDLTNIKGRCAGLSGG